MKNFTRKNNKIFLFMLFAILYTSFFIYPKEVTAQYNPISLEDKREQATLIIRVKSLNRRL